MARKKHIKSQQYDQDAFALEQSGDIPNAIKLYHKAVAADSLNIRAWNRQMILYRKTRSKADEAKLINTAIEKYQKAILAEQQLWLKRHQQKADHTWELADLLGLLEPSGLPKSDDTIIKKWQTRLHLLTYRIENTRKKSINRQKTNNSKIGKVKVKTPAKSNQSNRKTATS